MAKKKKIKIPETSLHSLARVHSGVTPEARAADLAKTITKQNARDLLNDEIAARQAAAMWDLPLKTVRRIAASKWP